MYIYEYILMVISYMSIVEGMMKSCRSIWEERVELRCNTRAEEKKISGEGSIWEVLREYGAGNRVLEEFTKEMRVLVEEGSLSKGSHRVYRGAIRRYMEWARVSELMVGIPSWPVRPVTLALYLTYLIKLKKSFSTVKGALFALKWSHKVEGWADPGDSPVIRQLVRAAVLDLYKSANRKWALDKEQVVKLIEAARGRDERGEKCFALFIVVIVLQWAGIARISEVLGVLRKDIEFKEDGGMDMKYRGKNANTANLRRREGDTKHYEETKELYCPTTIVRRFLRRKGTLELGEGDNRWEQAVFQVGGKPITYQWYSTRLVKETNG